MISTFLVRRFSCEARQKFQYLMRDTLLIQEPNILKMLKGRGIYYSLLALDASHELWSPAELRATVRSNLLTSKQKINPSYLNILKSHFKGDGEVLYKFNQKEYQYPQESIFKTANNKTIVLKEFGEQIPQEQYHRLLIEVAPTQHAAPSSEQPLEFEFKTVYNGMDLAAYLKEMFSFEHMYFQSGVFHLKYNYKLVRYFPPNIVYDYVRRSTVYPLQVEFIDLPTLYQVEEINTSKSLDQLEELFVLANHINIFTKLKYMKEFPQSCPTCSKSSNPPELPQGYLSVLAQDYYLFSNLKLKYLYKRVANACQENNSPYTILVVVGDEYIHRLKHLIASSPNILPTSSTVAEELSSIKKSLLSGLDKLATEQVPDLVKRSVMVELLLEANTDESAYIFQQVDYQLTENYMQSLEEYTKRLSLEVLNPDADRRLNEEVFVGQRCPGLELIFGNEEYQVEHEYDEGTLKREFEMIDSQTQQKKKEEDKQKKIKLIKP